MSKTYILLFIGVFISLLGFGQTGNNWKLIFEDNFDGTGFNTQNWSYCKRYGSDWNKYLVSSSQTVQVSNGELIVKAIKNTDLASDNVPYLTGGIETSKKFNFLYGKVEVRVKMVGGRGAWPAIWLMPDIQAPWPTGGEMDMMERLNNDAFIYHTVHSHYTYNLGINNPVRSKTAAISPDAYSVYGLQWYPDRLEFYLNGALTFTYPRIITTQAGQWPFDHPFYIILNQAAGGSWVGGVTDADLPFQMQVDYVKVYQRDSAQAYINPAWSNATYPFNSTHWKDEYVSSISSVGARNNVVYAASSHPAGYVVELPDTLILNANSNFVLNLKANSLGAYSESVVKQDLRYTHCTAFADFDGDKYFETVLPTIGNSPPTNGVGGNFNVMDVNFTFPIPANLLPSGRIRIVYRNAWSNLISPEAALNEGMIYDFPIRIVEKTSGLENEDNFSVFKRTANLVTISGITDESIISLLNGTGQVIWKEKISSDKYVVDLPRGFSILSIRNKSGKVQSQKFLGYL